MVNMNSCDSTKQSAGLSLISSYSSDDDETEEEDQPKAKRKCKERLPLPSAILNKSVSDINSHTDDSALHGGRVRSFPHARGNWVTYIYVSYEINEAYESFVDVVINEAKSVAELKAVSDPHISLTRTFVLLHHWIDSFVKSVEQQLKYSPSFKLSLDKLSVYTNEDNTRTFIGIDVGSGFQELVSSVEIIDECLKEFKLPVFYENPSFHLSFAWCLGDKRSALEEMLPSLDIYLKKFTLSHPEIFIFPVTKYLCKTGNKLFNFKLTGS